MRSFVGTQSFFIEKILKEAVPSSYEFPRTEIGDLVRSNKQWPMNFAMILTQAAWFKRRNRQSFLFDFKFVVDVKDYSFDLSQGSQYIRTLVITYHS